MLQGKVAVITGGTRGIGYATVKKFLENGAKVAMLGSREETVQKALASLKEENPEYPVVGYWPNLTKHEEVKEVFEKVKEEFGSLDVLVNNAGISARDPLYDYDPAAFEKIMDLNVNAVFNCSQVAACIIERAGRRCDLEHKFHGKYLWTASRMWISDIEICSKRNDKISGKRTWKGQYPCQCSGTGCDPHRYGSSTSRVCNSAFDQYDSTSPCRRTGRYRKCICISCK